MVNKEFCLSEKEWKVMARTESNNNIVANHFFMKADVKEFIRLLKKELFQEAIVRKIPLTDTSLDRLPMSYVDKIIDKLAGEKLT